MKKMTSEQKSIVKRGILLAGIVALLIVAAWVNGTLQDGGRAASVKTPKPTGSAAASATPALSSTSNPDRVRSGDYFADFRSDRADVRAEQIGLLNTVIEANADKTAVQEASARKVAISRYMEEEFALEQTLLAKGYDDVAAIVRDNLVTVAVKKAELDQTDAARILEAARNETGMAADSIKIIPVQ